jgi:hypothetical protein
MAKVQTELENPKVLQQILQQSVADVESMLYSPPKELWKLTTRTEIVQSKAQ